MQQHAASARWVPDPLLGSLCSVTATGPDAIIEFFAQRPALMAEMLRVHVDDGTGHCAGCRWWQSAQPTWPCPTVWYAQRAHERRCPNRGANASPGAAGSEC